MSVIWVIGSANIDFVSTVASLPLPGQTVHGSDLVTTFGGKGANQAVAAARLGGKVAFVGCVGEDEHGRAYREHLRAEGIDTTHLHDSPRTTGCALIVVDAAGANTIVVSPGANHALTPEMVEGLPLQRDDLVLLQFEIPMATNLRAAQRAREAGAKVMLNPSPAAACGELFECGIHTLLINEREGEFYTGVGAEELLFLDGPLAELRGAYGGALVLTRGEDPAWVYGGDWQIEVPGFAVEPVDTVGAGDTFAGALAVALAEGQDWPAATRFAHAAAARSTLSLGAQAAMPRRADLTF